MTPPLEEPSFENHWYNLIFMPGQLMHLLLPNLPGHLMGRKSIDTLPEHQGTNQDYVTPPHTAGATELHPYERLAAALVHHKNQKQTSPPAAGSLLWLRSGWREDDRDKYLREVSVWWFYFIISSHVHRSF